MQTVKLNWNAPTTRASGKSLDAATIAGYALGMSADGGKTYVNLTDNPASVRERLFTELEPGVWFFRVACFDNKNRASKFAIVSTDTDDSAPGEVINLMAILS